GITSAMIVQGIGFSMLFVPLTTVALSHVRRHQISDASGLNSVVRQFGGSVGLAVFTTLLTRFVVEARAGLIQHLDPGRPEVMQRLAMIRNAFMARGMNPASARDAAPPARSGSPRGPGRVRRLHA